MTRTPTTSHLMTEDLERRQDSVRYVLASTPISGLPITPDSEAQLNAWARGELSNDELIKRSSSAGDSN